MIQFLKSFAPPGALVIQAAAALGAVVAMALPSSAGAASAVEQLRSFVANTPAAKGSFVQQTRRPNAQGGPQQSGVFFFQRPGRFKWEVIKPYEQLLISDGKQLFQYDPDLAQVTVRDVGDAIGSSPAQILFGSAPLEQSFTVSELPARGGVEWLRAVPKSPDAGFARVDIGFKGGLPVSLELNDAFGQTTQIDFTNMERNPAVSADTFRFTPPKGVDVVRMGKQP